MAFSRGLRKRPTILDWDHAPEESVSMAEIITSAVGELLGGLLLVGVLAGAAVIKLRWSKREPQSDGTPEILQEV